MGKKYKSIIGILNNQIKRGINHKWAWIPKSDKIKEEFICTYNIIPDSVDCLYSPTQLLNKLNESNN